LLLGPRSFEQSARLWNIL